MQKFTYLIVDLGALIIPLIFSFHPRISFVKKWYAAIASIIITASIFIAWDMIFTAQGVWNFNPDYLTGIKLFNLPIEEILFFVCIPYSCLFTYYCISLWRNGKTGNTSVITFLLVVVLFSTGLFYNYKIYTSITFISLCLLLSWTAFVKRKKWLYDFYISYLLLIIPFLICNGILTGTTLDEPVVIYNSSEIIGIRLLTIPIEDLFYGMLLILVNVYLFEKFHGRRLFERAGQIT